MVGHELELSLDECYANFKEEHDSSTLEPIYDKGFTLLKQLHDTTLGVQYFGSTLCTQTQMYLKNTKKDNKLSPKYYSPYMVLQNIGSMAYKSELPSSS